MRGTVKTIRPTYGFLTDEQGTDRFFHQRDVEPASLPGIVVGARVEFTQLDVPPTPAEGMRRANDGHRATQVKVILA